MNVHSYRFAEEEMKESVQNRRIGLLIPSSNTVMEVDFYRNLPPQASVHTARMYMEETTVEGESRMLDEFALPAARDLATVQPHVVVFGCTSAGALRGNTYDEWLCHEIEKITGALTISVIRSVRNAITTFGAKRLAVLTPYVEALNRRVRASLEEGGLEVVSIQGMGISINHDIAEVSPRDIVEFAKKGLKSVEAELIFISCTNFRAMEALPELREIFSVPILSSNQVALEAAVNAISRRS